ncbi:MAG: RNA polymerase subunit sigma-70 [Oscillospiraceae bacterium]|nr:MAG: RNA polymerase subunit sigma-70 [Oscillospiraceae bacterium]
MEDSSIVDLYLARDERAIRETDGKYGKKLYSISHRITENDADTEECVSDTYLGAWTRIPPHEPRTYFFAFLARIVRAASIDRCRKNMRQKRTAHVEELTKELEECIAAPDDLTCRLDDRAIADALNGFLGTLTPETRQIFLRRYWYADSIRDLAIRFGYTEGKVKTLLFRTRARLRGYLDERGILL